MIQSRMFAVLHSESLTRATTFLFLTLSEAIYIYFLCSPGIRHPRGLSRIQRCQITIILSLMFAVLHSESLTRATTPIFLTLSKAIYIFFSARLVFGIQEVSLGFKGVRSP